MDIGFILIKVFLFQMIISCFGDSLDDVPGEPLSPQDFQNADKLTTSQLTTPLTGYPSSFVENIDPLENKNYYEGDIVMNQQATEHGDFEKASKETVGIWRRGRVPYLISSKFRIIIVKKLIFVGERERSVIARAVQEFRRQTCVKFIPRSTEKDYVFIIRGEGCSSPVGRQGGPQYVTLGDGCLVPGIVMHEYMHAIGLWHEQSRFDRDDYINVIFENIQPGMEENFRRFSKRESYQANVSYDTSSIMHYGPYAFSKNRQRQLKTIKAKITNDKMGQRTNFSATDVRKINSLYKCHASDQSDEEQDATDGSQQKCLDNHPNCPRWAQDGECQKNPSWMLVNCKLACNNCQTTCSNHNKHCDSWADSGECYKNPDYMTPHCSRACQKCK